MTVRGLGIKHDSFGQGKVAKNALATYFDGNGPAMR
jgi:CobQ-like glutamine amidotransferase family enzyme